MSTTDSASTLEAVDHAPEAVNRIQLLTSFVDRSRGSAWTANYRKVLVPCLKVCRICFSTVILLTLNGSVHIYHKETWYVHASWQIVK